MKDNWDFIARHWEQQGTPLRPAVEDLVFLQKQISEYRQVTAPLKALVLGATCEFYHLDWPAGTELRAADQSMQMLQTVWPGPRTTTIRANWMSLPLEESSQDIVLLDCGFSLLDFPAQHQGIVNEVQRILKPGGLFLFRVFVLPQEEESAANVLETAAAGQISQLNVLKLRLWMGMQHDTGARVGNLEYWQVLKDYWPDLGDLALLLGMDTAELQLASETKDQRFYNFMRLEDYLGVCEQSGAFVREALYFPPYTVGDRCPSVAYRCCKQTA